MGSDRQDVAEVADGGGQEERVVERAVERLVRRDCEWCGAPVTYSGRGRPPLYCSKSCRNRAYELRTVEARVGRQLAEGRVRTGPVREVVERTVTRTVERPVGRRAPVDPLADPAVLAAAAEAMAAAGDMVPIPTAAREWARLLELLAAQLSEPGRLRNRHFDHRHLHRGLVAVLRALDDAHPGGLADFDR